MKQIEELEKKNALLLAVAKDAKQMIMDWYGEAHKLGAKSRENNFEVVL